MHSSFLVVLLLAICHVQANVKAVFAHFMVSNTQFYSIADWENDMSLARDAKIDGFVMNMGKDEKTNGDSLANAFKAASNLGNSFKIVFSFDYAGNGLWEASKVIALINQYKSHPAYYHRGSQPLVSTFEGPKASPDWPGIKAATDCFFMPSWSSLGAKPAWELGTADGLFSWAAWPTGPKDMDTFTDASYLDTLNGKPYMMGVSPWFFTNMPGFRKNWLWKGDSLWFDRWINVLFLQPEYVQIITWNDYGESHYIGPLRANAYEAFERGKSPYNYVLGKHHNSWRAFLPYLIDLAKTNSTTITRENFVAWHRPHPRSACGSGGTTGNTASQLQEVFSPSEIVEDKVFFAAVLGSPATISVSIGGVVSAATWTHTPTNGIGLYRGSVDFNGRTGQVAVTLSRGGATILSSTGDAVTTSCSLGLQNWNPYTMSSAGRAITPVAPLPLHQVGCISGFGDKKYKNLCEVACKYNYCPRGACTCTNMGAPLTRPTAKKLFACPAPGIDSTYLGLCAMVCNYATCPDVCKIVPEGTVCNAPLPTAPPVPTCIKGMAAGAYATMCSFTCSRGFCPPEICSCIEAGTTPQLPAPGPVSNAVATFKNEEDYGLCEFTCRRGLCPSALCKCTGSGCPGGSGGSGPAILFENRLFKQPTRTMSLGAVTGELTTECTLGTYCYDPEYTTPNCGNGMKPVGHQASGQCGQSEGHPICCPNNSGLSQSSCRWRDGDDEKTGICNGQCKDYEVPWGDGDRYGDNIFEICNSGKKAFCCDAPAMRQAVDGCRWTKCGEKGCGDNEKFTATRFNYCSNQQTMEWGSQSTLCCPTNSAVKSCEWRGTGPKCENNQCLKSEFPFLKDEQGAYHENRNFGNTGCLYDDGYKTLCCDIEAPKTGQLDIDMCGDDRFCEENPACVEYAEEDSVLSKRHSHLHSHGGVHLNALFERANGKKTIQIAFSILIEWSMIIRKYRVRQENIDYFLQPANQNKGFYYTASEKCWEVGITKRTISKDSIPPKAMDAEHVLDAQALGDGQEFAMLGTRTAKKGNPEITSKFRDLIPYTYFKYEFDKPLRKVQPGQLSGLPLMGQNRDQDLLYPNDRLSEIIGSETNQYRMPLLDKNINIMKSSVISGKDPMSRLRFKGFVNEYVREGSQDKHLAPWMVGLRNAVNVFLYVNEGDIAAALTIIIKEIGDEYHLIEQEIKRRQDEEAGPSDRPPLNLRDRWIEFIQLYLEESARNSQQWHEDMSNYAIQQLQSQRPVTQTNHDTIQYIHRIGIYRDRMVWPGYKKGKGKGKEKANDDDEPDLVDRMVKLSINGTDVDILERNIQLFGIVS